MFLLPSHWKPFPVNPALQTHEKPMDVSLHKAFWEHGLSLQDDGGGPVGILRLSCLR